MAGGAVKGRDKEQGKKMRLTAQDKGLVELIERWGFMSVEDVCIFQRYKNRNSAVWRLKRLVDGGVIRREKIIFGFFIYTVLDFHGVNIATFEHDQTAKRLALYLSNNLKCDYKTITELRSTARLELGVAGLTKKIPDFVLMQGEQRIAVELELSQKNLARQRAVFDKYIEAFNRRECHKVFFYCGSKAILDRVRQVITEKRLQQAASAALLPEKMNHG